MTDLVIHIRQWRDATRNPESTHPEIVITGTAAGLRHLQRQIDFVLENAADPEVHSHLLDGDPGVSTTPPKVMLTIGLLDTPSNGAAVHSAP